MVTSAGIVPAHSARVKNRRAAARSRAASPPTHNCKSQRGCVPTAQHSCRSQVKIRLRLYSGEEAALLLDGTPACQYVCLREGQARGDDRAQRKGRPR